MADTMNGVPIGDLPGIESVPDDSMLVVEFLGKAYSMPGTVLKQLFQDILDAMGSSVDDVTEARLTAAIETVLASGKYNGVSPIVEVTTDENGKSVLHVVDAYGIKDYPVEVKGATDAVRYNPQELTDAQQKQARKNTLSLGFDNLDVTQEIHVIKKGTETFHIGDTLTITLYDHDGTEKQKVSVKGEDVYNRARAAGYNGSEASFWMHIAGTDVIEIPPVDGMELDPDTNELFLTSGGSRIPMMGVVLPTSGGEAGEDGEDGKDGTTFTPNVDEYGDLSWTNDGGLPNPATVNIRGPRGYAGINGLDGADGEDGGTTYVSSIADMGTYTRIGLTESRSGATQYVDIPHGADGATGPQGPAGPAGADGESVYVSSVTDYDTYTEIGITHSQSGSEQLVRIPHGKDGTDGEDGGTVYVSSVTDMGTYTRIGLKESKTGATQYIDIPHGKDGPAGEAATIEEVTAEVDGSYLAQPTVTVTPGGTAQKRTFHFAFKGLRGLSGSGTGGGVPSDWGENDPSSASHVFRRTHWKEVYDGPEGEVISETSVAFTSNIKTITGAMSDAIHAGGLYIDTWNGLDYRCIGKASSDGNYIGNGSFMNAGNITFEDTGEPFCVLQFGGTYYMVYKANTTAETVTVKVVGKKETVWHKLDGGYLPEGVPYSEGVKLTELYSALVEIDPDSGGYEGVADVPLTEGETYVVKYNGVDYVCTCSTMTQGDEYNGMVTFYILGNLGAITGGDDTGEPFVVMTIPSMGAFGLYALDGSTSVTLSVSGEVETIHKMDGKLLPEGTPYVEPLDDVILEETVLADTQVGEGSSYETFLVLPISNISVGSTYEVVLDGVRYLAKAYASNMPRFQQSGVTAIVIGSGLLTLNNGTAIDFDTPYEPVPFGLMVLPTGAYEFNVWGVWTDGIPERISIRCVSRVHKMDMDCLPDFPIPLVVNITNINNISYEADLPYAEVASAVSCGRLVFVRERFETTEDCYMYPFSHDTGGYLRFSNFHDGVETYFSWSSNEIKKYTISYTKA